MIRWGCVWECKCPGQRLQIFSRVSPASPPPMSDGAHVRNQQNYVWGIYSKRVGVLMMFLTHNRTQQEKHKNIANISQSKRRAIHVENTNEHVNLEKQDWRVLGDNGPMLMLMSYKRTSEFCSGLQTWCPASCVLHHPSPQRFLLLWTHLTIQSSLCILYMWKAKSNLQEFMAENGCRV